MNRRRPNAVQLRAALGEIQAQVDYICDRGSETFLGGAVESRVLQAAACHLIIQFQAVLDDLPEWFGAESTDLPLAEVRGMRNRLAHGYGDIDAQMLWTTIDDAFPALTSEIIRRLEVDH